MSFEAFDLPILSFMTSFTGKSIPFDNIMGALSRFDTFKGVFMTMLLWAAWFHRPVNETPAEEDKRHGQILVVFAGSIAVVVISRLLQRLMHVHQRPALADLGLRFPTFPDALPLNSWNSFPSDHVMLFCSLAVGLWYVNRRLSYVAFFWTLTVISIPRMYLGFHYPSDVVGGLILGIPLMIGIMKLPLQGLTARVIAWQKKRSGLFFGLAFFATSEFAHLFDDIREMAGPLLHSFYGSGWN